MPVYKFNESAISNAIEAAKRTHESTQLNANESDFDIHKGACLSMSAECITVEVENHQICLDLPMKLGKHCIGIPINFPNGTDAQACLSLCAHWGIPTGVEVTVKILGVTVASQKFGKC